MNEICGIISNSNFLINNKTLLDQMLSVTSNENSRIIKLIDDAVGIQVGCNIFSEVYEADNFICSFNDITMIFIGEIYGFVNTNNKDNMNDKNAGAKQICESLIKLYEREGLDFLEKLNGWFNGLLIDYKKRFIYLFNDMFGIKRIYFYISKDAFYFSSSARSLLKILPDLRYINYETLAEFFALGCTFSEESLFKGISVFPAGSVFVFYNGNLIRKLLNFCKIAKDEDLIDINTALDLLRTQLPIIINRYYKKSEKAAVSLTGGLDTRLIMAYADFPPYKVPCYTFSGILRECIDAKIAKMVATVCQQQHHIIKIKRSFFSEFPYLAKKTVIDTDGTMDITGAAELFVLRQARDIAPIRINGNFGDQILRGISGFSPKLIDVSILNTDFVKHVFNRIEAYYSLSFDRYLDYFLKIQLPYFHYPRLALEQTHLIMRSPFLDADLIKIVYRLPKGTFISVDQTLNLIYAGNRFLAKIPTDRGLNYSSPPFLRTFRRAIREFFYKAEYIYDYGMPNYFSRIDSKIKIINLQNIFLGRQKYYHYRAWYKNELSNYVRDILLSRKSLNRNYINRYRVEQIVKDHISGKGNYTREISYLLTAELLHRYLVESS